ncbi:response regulator transcription factor [Novosphingopyxis sp. YJ-S2-01]|uniref:response regulator transcription factor n=1 Tax=Novosphingopyxis sp. YJ-S2-01 TaxID=2794021 RepID=UPI0018DC8123|nr:response regulator transcription factor [Novosphingopyxis sp. YJ-S2-01]MBH9536621.1 response regulator transcription factor [Novosphingopyxis sp. YJ-S2-01]
MARRAIIVDDHPMCRRATAMAFQAVDPAVTLVESDTLEDARRLAATADMVAMDIAMPGSRGMIGLAEFREEFPDVPLLIISGNSNPDIEREVSGIGANGFLSKEASMPDMVEAIRTVLDNGTWFSGAQDGGGEPTELERIQTLTPAQMRVLKAMQDGALNKQIAYDLGLSEVTVKAHVKAILKKLSVPNRTQAILMLARIEQ